MEKKQLKLCPLGMQDFQEIIQKERLYVDKTRQMYELTHGAGKYVFLSRPRRFGKSLLASTLHYYFDGRRDLFKGLAIDQLEKDWIKYPVLHFDMSTAKNMNKEELESELSGKLTDLEAIWGSSSPDQQKPNQRLSGLIKRAYEQTGKQVVVLIDEYDAPLLDVLHEDTDLPILRNVMRNFYSPLKSCDKYLRFVFLTGITKFSQLSIFSELNNIKNVSMEPEFADICGITKEELAGQLSDYIDAMAEANGCTHDEMLEQLAYRYDGYHFTWPSPDIFNPFSIINAFSDKRLGNYWFGSGTPTFLIEMMRKFAVAPTEIGSIVMRSSGFDAPAEHLTSIYPLLYQSGYLTIKDYNPISKLYTLDIPNQEIRIGLMESLLPNYVSNETVEGQTTISQMCEHIIYDRLDEALKLLKAYLLTVPQCDNTNYEGHYQQLLYVLFSLLGYEVDVEVRTDKGRIDIVMRTDYAIYLMEVKINKTAVRARKQIDVKRYGDRFALEKRPIIKVGINFSTDKHTLTGWVIDDPRKA
ncbi:MAG: AAA family ATPase [Muribaculaceae bacterium]